MGSSSGNIAFANASAATSALARARVPANAATTGSVTSISKWSASASAAVVCASGGKATAKIPREELNYATFFPDLDPNAKLRVHLDYTSAITPSSSSSSSSSGGRNTANCTGRQRESQQQKTDLALDIRIDNENEVDEEMQAARRIVGMFHTPAPLKEPPKPRFRENPDYASACAPRPPEFQSALGSHRFVFREIPHVEYDMDEIDCAWAREHQIEFTDFEAIMNALEASWFKLTAPLVQQQQQLSSYSSMYKQTCSASAQEKASLAGSCDSEGHCAVCGDDECDNLNAIVFCDGCNLAVHQDCYGIPFIPEGQWRCRACLSVPSLLTAAIQASGSGDRARQDQNQSQSAGPETETETETETEGGEVELKQARRELRLQLQRQLKKRSPPSQRLTCILCGQCGGALKQTTAASSTAWAHLLCALWIPEVDIFNRTYMEPIDVSRMSPERTKLLCTICRRRVGACIQCAHRSCATAFHVTCARSAGYQMRSDYQVLCQRHASNSTSNSNSSSNSSSSASVSSSKSNSNSKSKSKSKSNPFAKPAPSMQPQVDSTLPFVGAKRNAAALHVSIPDHHNAQNGLRNQESAVSKRDPNEYNEMCPVVPRTIYNSVRREFPLVSARNVAAVCRHWSVRRQARGGAPLLRRLLVDPKLLAPRAASAMRRASLRKVLSCTEKLRSLVDAVRRREKQKCDLFGAIANIWHVNACPFVVASSEAIAQIRKLDTRAVFHRPVDPIGVPDYLHVIEKPIDLHLMQLKAERGYYFTLDQLKEDFELMFSNAMKYNAQRTVYYADAVRLKNALRKVLESMEKKLAEQADSQAEEPFKCDLGLLDFILVSKKPPKDTLSASSAFTSSTSLLSASSAPEIQSAPLTSSQDDSSSSSNSSRNLATLSGGVAISNDNEVASVPQQSKKTELQEGENTLKITSVDAETSGEIRHEEGSQPENYSELSLARYSISPPPTPSNYGDSDAEFERYMWLDGSEDDLDSTPPEPTHIEEYGLSGSSKRKRHNSPTNRAIESRSSSSSSRSSNSNSSRNKSKRKGVSKTAVGGGLSQQYSSIKAPHKVAANTSYLNMEEPIGSSSSSSSSSSSRSSNISKRRPSRAAAKKSSSEILASAASSQVGLMLAAEARMQKSSESGKTKRIVNGQGAADSKNDHDIEKESTDIKDGEEEEHESSDGEHSDGESEDTYVFTPSAQRRVFELGEYVWCRAASLWWPGRVLARCEDYVKGGLKGLAEAFRRAAEISKKADEIWAPAAELPEPAAPANSLKNQVYVQCGPAPGSPVHWVFASQCVPVGVNKQLDSRKTGTNREARVGPGPRDAATNAYSDFMRVVLNRDPSYALRTSADKLKTKRRVQRQKLKAKHLAEDEAAFAAGFIYGNPARLRSSGSSRSRRRIDLDTPSRPSRSSRSRRSRTAAQSRSGNRTRKASDDTSDSEDHDADEEYYNEQEIEQGNAAAIGGALVSMSPPPIVDFDPPASAVPAGGKGVRAKQRRQWQWLQRREHSVPSSPPP